MVPIPAPLAGLTVLAPRPPPELAAECTSHTRRFWLIRQTEQIRASARPRRVRAQNLEPANPWSFDGGEEVVRDADRGVGPEDHRSGTVRSGTGPRGSRCGRPSRGGNTAGG